MSELLGFCRTSQADEPIDADGWCVEHHTLALAPSWGSRTQRLVDGAWQPHKARPAGYTWKPKYTDVAPTPRPLTARQVTPTVTRATHCEHCGVSLDASARGGSVQRYCSSLCKARAAKARQREKKRAVAV